MSEKILEHNIVEKILKIIDKELKTIKPPELDAGQIMKLEKLAKVFAVTVGSKRHIADASDMTDEELSRLTGEDI